MLLFRPNVIEIYKKKNTNSIIFQLHFDSNSWWNTYLWGGWVGNNARVGEPFANDTFHRWKIWRKRDIYHGFSKIWFSWHADRYFQAFSSYFHNKSDDFGVKGTVNYEFTLWIIRFPSVSYVLEMKNPPTHILRTWFLVR